MAKKCAFGPAAQIFIFSPRAVKAWCRIADELLEMR
jgi:hypothetical protein